MRALLFAVFASALVACGGGSAPSSPTLGPWSAERVFATHRESDVRFASADGTVLAGTMLMPPATSGAFPVVVFQNGSGAWTRWGYDAWTAPVLARGIAVFTYDKRGAGESGGSGVEDLNGLFKFSEDVEAAFHTARAHPGADPARIMLFGHSQGSLTVPLAVARGALPVRAVVLSGGISFSTAENHAYALISGKIDANGNRICVDTGITQQDADAFLDTVPIGGYDPRPILAGLGGVPMFWIWGGIDRNIALDRSKRIVDQMIADGRDWGTHLVPNANHAFVIGGVMCQTAGPMADWFTPTYAWIAPRLGP